MSISADQSRAIGELAAALLAVLSATGEHSIRSVAEGLSLTTHWTDQDDRASVRRLVEQAWRQGVLQGFVEAVVTRAVAHRPRSAPVSDAELDALARATDELGPSEAGPEASLRPTGAPRATDTPSDTEPAERRARALTAHAELFAQALTADPAERLAMLANVLGGLAVANGADMVRAPTAADDRIGGMVRLEGSEYYLDFRWTLGAPEAALGEAADRAREVSDRTILLGAIDGVTGTIDLDPDRDARTVLLSGEDLTRLLEGRWSLVEALAFKRREQAVTRAFAALPLAPPTDPEPAPEEAPVPATAPLEAPTPIRATPAPEPEDDRVVSSNVEAHEQQVSIERASEAAERRRLRMIGIGIVAAAILAIIVMIVIAQQAQAASAADLAAAERTALRGIRSELDAFRTLDASGLRQFYSDALAAQLEQAIERLRAQGVFLDSTEEFGVLQSEARDRRAVVVARGAGELLVRALKSSELLSRTPQTRTIALGLEKSDAGRWQVVERQDV